VVRAFQPLIERNLAAASDACRAASWRYLQLHADLCIRFAGVLEARARGEKERSLALWQELVGMVQRQEMALQPVFDVFEFIETIGRKIS